MTLCIDSLLNVFEAVWYELIQRDLISLVMSAGMNV